MDEARRVLARLERIDELERRLLEELHALAPEAECWARAEQNAEATAAAAGLVRALAPRPWPPPPSSP